MFTKREREIALERGSRGTKADIGAVVNKGEQLPCHFQISVVCYSYGGDI